ncbi:MAG: aldo/keto reductase [Clostridia bacterium]
MKKFGFGLMRLPLLNKEDQTSIDIDHVCKMADKFLKAGFTYFDTAACYHNGASEVAFCKAVSSRYPRESYSITDKLSLWMVEDGKFENFFNSQLERLGVDYLDYYLLHAVNKNGYKEACEKGAIEFMKKKKAEGKVKHIGFSFHDSVQVLDEILSNEPEMEIVQLQINYLDWEDENVQSKMCYSVAQKYNKPVLVMEPVKGGSLANVRGDVRRMFKSKEPDMSIASWAIRYAATLDGVATVLSGMSCEEQVNDNLGYMKDFKPLTKDEIDIVMKAAKMIRADVLVPCTACRYCVPDCPMSIEIPEYFKAYNMLKSEGFDKAKEKFDFLSKKGSRPSDCIKCGMCESLCPQKLGIRDFLEDVTEELGK